MLLWWWRWRYNVVMIRTCLSVGMSSQCPIELQIQLPVSLKCTVFVIAVAVGSAGTTVWGEGERKIKASNSHNNFYVNAMTFTPLLSLISPDRSPSLTVSFFPHPIHTLSLSSKSIRICLRYYFFSLFLILPRSISVTLFPTLYKTMKPSLKFQSCKVSKISVSSALKS